MDSNARPKTVDHDAYCSAPPFTLPPRPSREEEARRKREPLWSGEPRAPEVDWAEYMIGNVKPDVKPDIPLDIPKARCGSAWQPSPSAHPHRRRQSKKGRRQARPRIATRRRGVFEASASATSQK